jgi:hypothetical protein
MLSTNCFKYLKVPDTSNEINFSQFIPVRGEIKKKLIIPGFLKNPGIIMGL